MMKAQLPYTIDNLRVPANHDRNRVFQKAVKFIENDDDLKLDSINEDSGFLLASGSFPYHNQVKCDLIDLSLELNKLTSGRIYYDFEVNVTDSTYFYTFTKFTHRNRTNSHRYNLGLITKESKYFVDANRFDRDWTRLIHTDMIKTCDRMTRTKWIKIHW